MTPFTRLKREEGGNVLIMMVIWLPLILVFAAFVVDVGNWFEHKRHLQLQADAAALAGGGSFAIPCTSGANTAIQNIAWNYAGPDALHPTSQFNAQIGGTPSSKVHALLNSTNYWNNGGVDFDGDITANSPCVKQYLDVKMTEASNTKLSFFSPVLKLFGSSLLAPTINAHARVALKQKSSSAGSLPIAVPDVRPKDGAVFVVNESSQAILARSKLTNPHLATLNGKSMTQWDAVTPGFTVASNDIGVVVALSGNPTWVITGSLATICAQPLVICYYNSGTNVWHGLVYLRGYSPTAVGTATNPVLRDVGLFTGGGTPCSDTSAPSFLLNAPASGCTLGVRAQIDWGTGGTPPAGAVVKIPRTPSNGCPNSGPNPKGCVLTFATTGTNAGYWVTTQFPTFMPDTGPQTVDFGWQTNASSGSLTGAQRAFSTTASLSGPIQFVQVADGATIGPTSLAFGSHPTGLAVAVGVTGNLQNDTKFNDPTTVLRVADPSGSRNHAIDCDPGVNWRDQVRYGCSLQYQINPGEACPNATLPLDCAAIVTGDKTGPLRQGMDLRFASCPTNHWTNPGDPTQMPVILPGDPRAIPAIIVPFGAFDGSGNGYVPISDFGTFYVTGWDYTGSPTCPDNEPFPGTGSSKGDIWGHFIKYVDALNTGGGTGTCDPTAFGSCVVVLTD